MCEACERTTTELYDGLCWGCWLDWQKMLACEGEVEIEAHPPRTMVTAPVYFPGVEAMSCDYCGLRWRDCTCEPF